MVEIIYNFNGISPKARALLAENQFNDSKDFYDENKEMLKQIATIPMRQIMLDLSETLLELDDEIYVNPLYSVSRIRRDTRFSKNKSMYRENLWVMFRRNKKLYSNVPFMWFEFYPDSFSYGIALFTEKPGYMESFRKRVTDNSEIFFKAVECLEKTGVKLCSESYKSVRFENSDARLQGYLNLKNIQFLKADNNMKKINDKKLIDELKQFVISATPMYNFLIDVHNDINIRREAND